MTLRQDNHLAPFARQGDVKGTLIGATLLLAASMALHAQPAGHELLEGVQVSHRDGLLQVDVQLSRPFRFLGSCPQRAGATACLRLAAPDPGEGAAAPWQGRERLEVRDGQGLRWVEYDGAAAGGPLLYLHFDRPVVYRVLPDAGRRRFLISVMPSL